MTRNAIESYFRASKIAAAGHFMEIKKKGCIFIWNGEKCDQKRFSGIQNCHFKKKNPKTKSCVFIWSGEIESE